MHGSWFELCKFSSVDQGCSSSIADCGSCGWSAVANTAQSTDQNQALQATAPAAEQAPATAAPAAAKTMPDAAVEANVLKALAGAPDLANQPMTTTTVYGVVTLSGSVESEALRVEAETIVSKTKGVKKVVDEMTLGGENANAQTAQPAQAPVVEGSPDSDNTGSANQVQNQAPNQSSQIKVRIRRRSSPTARRLRVMRSRAMASRSLATRRRSRCMAGRRAGRR